MNNQTRGINQSFQGFYRVAVVDTSTKEVVWEQKDWKKNLILNQGMDGVYGRAVTDLMLYGCAGTGARPNSKSSGVSTITQSGVNVFLYNAGGDITDFSASFDTYTHTVEAGDVLKYANNSESKVVSVADALNLTVDTSYTIASGQAQAFTVWKTSQVGLQTEVSRSAAYLVGTGNCGTTIASNTATHRRTYDFTAAGASVSFNELGVAWASTGANTVFSRILLGSPIAVNLGYQLRMIYDLQTTWTPETTLYKTASIGGWPVSPSTSNIGSESLQVLLTSTVQTSDGASIKSTAILDPYFVNEGAVYSAVWASTSSAALAAFGSAADRSGGNAGSSTSTAMSKAGQVLGTYVVDKTGTIPIGASNFGIRSFGIGRYQVSVNNPAAASNQVITFVLDEAQVKNSTQTLSFIYRWTWTRTLS